jgi:CRISPR/Cas system-associated exonuclease Cas4 (RecB family)
MTQTTIPSWSISRIQVFEQCQYRAKLQWLDKIPDNQPKTAADRGSAIHLEAENYVLGKGELTHNLRHFSTDLTALKDHHAKGRVTVEEEWAFDRDWKVTDWRKGWLRLKCDAVCHLSSDHLVVIDHKTGKRFGNEIKHAVQLQLYAVCALIRYPDVERVTCELWYLDQNELASFVLHRRQLSKYLGIFDKKGRQFTETTQFKPNPNIVTCKYCPYHPDRQGDCQYGTVVTQNGKIVRPTKPIVVPKGYKVDAAFADEAAAFAKLGE